MLYVNEISDQLMALFAPPGPMSGLKSFHAAHCRSIFRRENFDVVDRLDAYVTAPKWPTLFNFLFSGRVKLGR